MGQSEFRFTAKHFDAELQLAAAITRHTSRDLFEGVTERAERQVRARICIVMQRLWDLPMDDSEETFAAAFTRIYGEAFTPPTTQGKRHAQSRSAQVPSRHPQQDRLKTP